MFCLQVAGMLAAGTLACWLAFFIFMAANTRPPHAIDPDMGKQSTAQINMQLKLTFGAHSNQKGAKESSRVPSNFQLPRGSAHSHNTPKWYKVVQICTTLYKIVQTGAEGHHYGAILAQKADTEGGQTGQAT